eukprot:CAMPEP_0198286538 /NCGR_PEP_ID=MMETSP1449-20131203/5605_1 /TAXON_ID=420275 /ORGANISM="Attheya septentrionalis, Strain CCMP2084" /LENGTH=573 /DNA_ID=CAMNT_0043984315 /DNA_START=158 /DNA_END=1879 /DNA_ORIENTATION=+
MKHEDGWRADTDRMSPHMYRFLTEVREQWKTSLPAMMGMLLYKIPWLLSLRFVGNIGSEELAAAALATTLCNVTGMSLSVGLSSALSTLTGQARGDLRAKAAIIKARITIQPEEQKENRETESLLNEKDHHARYDDVQIQLGDTPLEPDLNSIPLSPLVYLYRGLFIQLLFVIPVGVWWLFGIKPLLIRLGQGELLSGMTEKYLRILTPGLWSYSVNWTLTTWAQSLEMADVPAWAASVGLILHIPLNLLFIHVFGWGYLGVGVATVAFQAVQPVVILFYLFGTQQGSSRLMENMFAQAVGRTNITFWKEAKLAISSFSGIMQYLSMALPGIIIISEWWASEISIFLAGTLLPGPDLALSGMTIYQSINTFCFMFPVGCSVAGSTRVSNFLGSGDTKGADLAAKVSVTCAFLLSTLMGCILIFTPHSFFPSFFTPDENVISEASRLLPLLALYVVGDGIQISLNAIIKACGKQYVMMPIVVVAYWVVGVPLGYYITFIRHDGYMCEDSYFCGVTGLVMGLTTGTYVHMLLLAIVVVCSTNWEVESRKAKERLALEKHTKVTHQEDNQVDMRSI